MSAKKNRKKGCFGGCLTVFLMFLGLCAILSFIPTKKDKLNSLEISANTAKTYDINTSIPIELEANPDDTDLKYIKCNASGGTFTNDDSDLVFKADKTGTYDLSVSIDSVKSNTITLIVEDKATIAKEVKKAEEAVQKAEEERLAAEQAEAQKKADEEAAAQAAQKKAEEEAAAQAAAQATQPPQEQMVWISATGSKYHNTSSCGQMNPATSYQMTLSEAQANGYEACKRCH